MQDILKTEYGGMNEVLYNLSRRHRQRLLRHGRRPLHEEALLQSSGLRRDELRGLHVNTHIPQVIGAARRYEITGDMRFHDVADFFWYEIDQRANVCNGWNEQRRMVVDGTTASLRPS